MKPEEDLPLDLEIEEIALNRQLSKTLDKLTLYEEGAGKDLKSLANRMKYANKELKTYLETQNQVVRLYIQLLNRNSDLITNHDLQMLKAHVKKIETRVQNQEELITQLRNLSSGYKEYSKSLREYTKGTENLLKSQENWHNASSDYAKVKRDPRVTGTKLEKIENKVSDRKKKVIKTYDIRRQKNSLVKHNIVHISEGYLKLKNAISKIEW